MGFKIFISIIKKEIDKSVVHVKKSNEQIAHKELFPYLILSKGDWL